VNWTLDEILRFVMADGHSRYPVIHGSLDGVVGILLVKDLIHHFQRSPMGSWTRVIRKPYFISEIAPLRTVLRDMKRLGIHMALVRNETGVLTGLLTLEEILEEIVGEIRDETDDPGESGSGFILGPSIVSGEISILDFNDRFRASLPIEGSYSTLNGYLLSRTGGQLPPVGTLIFTDDLSFRIHSVSDKGIATIEIVEPAKPGV
jgi:CBS domain containing-hemolysin-like protein